MPSTITAEKARLRRQALDWLANLSPQARTAGDEALFHRFLTLPQAESARTILLYHGMDAEPDTVRLLPPLWGLGKRVCLPRCLPGNQMEARLVQPDSTLIRHPYGMLEPDIDCSLIPPDQIDLVLVPGLAFDRSGGRLGRGGGYYDRWLAGFSGVTAALCRDGLLMEDIPRLPHDLGVDLVVTETGLYGPSAPGQEKSGA
ncbi:MAG: 5-formyltetrahydrofolate cyclo-ligase [Clostridiales bacterium]|uniref:5-formyltetrahydrofolate cyclo-ligase n=1 Tax=Flavonifractor porci TaxID=3133422 RepID=UPI0030993E2D|nr:5-formyltetrahydrofolate cyclo-ligase [Clostridiales bacterium]